MTVHLHHAGGRLPKGTGAAQVCAAAGEGDVRTVKLLHEFGVSVETGEACVHERAGPTQCDCA